VIPIDDANIELTIMPLLPTNERKELGKGKKEIHHQLYSILN